jgi:hypothetical protein
MSMRKRRRAAGQRRHLFLALDWPGGHISMVGRWTAPEMASIRRDPWQLFKPANDLQICKIKRPAS